MIRIDDGKCVKCGICTEVCAVSAITPASFEVNQEDCFQCCNCLSVCHRQAISFGSFTTEGFRGYSIASEDFRNLIRNRRSCRNYQPRNIDKSVIGGIAEELSYSPTGGNLQGVNVTVLDHPDKVRKLSDRINELFIAYGKLGYLLVPMLGLKNALDFLRLVKRLKTRTGDILTHNAPAALVFHADPKSTNTPHEDCSIAAAVAVLYAEVSDLGTCFNGYLSIGLNYSRRIRKMLGIPKGHRVYAALTIGYPKYTYRNMVYRKSVSVEYPEL